MGKSTCEMNWDYEFSRSPYHWLVITVLVPTYLSNSRRYVTNIIRKDEGVAFLRQLVKCINVLFCDSQWCRITPFLKMEQKQLSGLYQQAHIFEIAQPMKLISLGTCLLQVLRNRPRHLQWGNGENASVFSPTFFVGTHTCVILNQSERNSQLLS